MSAHDPQVELQIGDTRTDITDDVFFDGGISHARGRSGEGSRVDPATVGMKLKSPNGKYSPRNPNSPNYGLIGRNTPLWASIGGASVILDIPQDSPLAKATTPDHAALDITGDIDVRADLTPAAWAGAFTNAAWEVMAKYDTASNQRSWRLIVRDDGRIQFTWSPDGTALVIRTSTAPVPHIGGHRGAIRATLDVNNGAAGHTVAFYTAPTMAGPWVQLGTPVVTAGVTSVFASTAALEVGDIAVLGFASQQRHYHAIEVRSGIGGTAVANPVFTSQVSGTTGFSDAAGRVWSLANGATITDRRDRFAVEVSEWSPKWTVGAADVNSPIQGGGILRRLSQGQKALESTLRRRVPSYSPLAYWPMEDEDGAVQAYSPVAGVLPMRVIGTRFGQDDTLAGSSALPTVEAGGGFVGTVPPPAGSSTQWSVHMVYLVDEAPVTDGEFLTWRTSGTVRRWRILQRAGVGTIQGYDSNGDLSLTQPVAIGADVFAGWNRLHFKASESGGTVTWSLDWHNIGGLSGGYGSTYAGSAGRVTQIDTTIGASVTGLRVGHLAVIPVAASEAYSLADHGFNGETAGARLVRLTAEEGVPFRLMGVAADQTAMGPQRPAPLLDLLRECEDSDGGILFEDRNRLGLVYRGRATLYNQQPALTLTYAQINEPFEPVDDDSRTRNDVTRTRSGGSSARVVKESGPLSILPPPLGVGTYDESATLSLASDAQPEQIAAWAMHLGTWDEARYKQLHILLHKHPSLISAVTDLDVGDVVRITGLPPFLPPGPVDLLVEGYREDLTGLTWEINLNCSPAGPWSVGVLEDPILGKADTEGSELVAAVDSDETLLTVATTAGPIWVTDPAQLPFDVTLGGEVVTVTDITGARGDRFDRSVTGGWGTATSGQAWTTSGGVASDYSVQGG